MTEQLSGHAGMAARWGELTIAEQMAHVGSEVERALRASEAHDETRRDFAIARALELFDLTAADERWRGCRRREILRAREAFCGQLLAPDASAAGSMSLRKYFLAFAVLALQAPARQRLS